MCYICRVDKEPEFYTFEDGQVIKINSIVDNLPCRQPCRSVEACFKQILDVSFEFSEYMVLFRTARDGMLR